MAEEVEALCETRYHPDHQSFCHRAGLGSGIAYLDGGKEEIRRPRVRHECDGEVRLPTYEAASSPLVMFDETVARVVHGLPMRGVERVTGKVVSKSAAPWMWAEKSCELLGLLRTRPHDDAAWLSVVARRDSHNSWSASWGAFQISFKPSA